jgi:hypothetical protein
MSRTFLKTMTFLLLALLLLGGGQALYAEPTLQQDARYFSETGYRVDNDVIWDYFQARGAVNTFGYPASESLTYRGFEVQIFQRHVLQVMGNQARPLNLLDPDVMPINELNGSTFPTYDESMAKQAPSPDTPNYGSAVRAYLEAMVPNAWQGKSVGYLDYYLSAAPASAGNLRTLIALEVWGFPTSQPKADPNNANFIYQRFQRGIMHYDATNNFTLGILLGDAFKDRNGQAASNPQPTAAPQASATAAPQATVAPQATATTAPAAPPPASGQASIMGVEVGRGKAVAGKAGEAKLSWVRYNGILWPDVEPNRGNRNWGALSGFENDIKALSAEGLSPIVIVRQAPSWAQKDGLCGPIREDALDDFANFMAEVVNRYKGSPYNVKYWEMGNEPDVDPSLIDPSMPFGCWGDASDPYYGGGYYAEMLKKVYPAIKAADPNAKVVMGGVLLDCDPTNPPDGKDCLPSKFLEGILRNGGGNALDIISFHAYGLWWPSIIDSDLSNPAWQHRGGALLGKLDFIRTVMRDYGVNKPIHMNEGGLLCHESNSACPSDTFFNAQATYIPRLYARAWANGIQAVVWYSLDDPGWRHAGLLDPSGNIRPAYTALKFMSNLLGGARYKQRLSSGNLEGYAFQQGSTEYYIYWTNDGSTQSVSVPNGTQAAYNKLGQSVSFSSTVNVGVEPIYLQVSR